MPEITTRDGCRISYRSTGSGPQTLVVLPGWSQTAAQFDRLIPLLGDEFRVITYDHRNHGRSGRSEGGARIATLAADLRELLDQLDIDSAHMLGHSMGCSVLWSFIDQHGTDRVDSLVLVDQPTMCALMPWIDATAAGDVGAILDFDGVREFAAALLGPDSDQARADFLASMLSPDISESDHEWLRAENMTLSMPFGVRLLVDHIMQDWRDVLPAIDVPTLVIGGEVSHVAATSQEWTASRIPGARLRVFTREEGGSHFPFFESPDTFAEVLRGFVSSDATTGTVAENV